MGRIIYLNGIRSEERWVGGRMNENSRGNNDNINFSKCGSMHVGLHES